MAEAATPQPDETIRAADPTVAEIVEQSPYKTLQALLAAASAGEAPSIGLLYRHFDFKTGADLMMGSVFPGVEIVESTAVNTIAEAVRERSLLFILTEGGNDQMAGRYLLNQLNYDREDKKLQKQNPPIIWARRDPGPSGAYTDPSVDRLAANNGVDVFMKTPFTVEDFRIAVAEAIMRNSGKLQEVERVAAEKVMNQFITIASVLINAWKEFLEKPVKANSRLSPSLDSDPAAEALADQLSKVEDQIRKLDEELTLAGIGSQKKIKDYSNCLIRPLRELRSAMGLALSQLSIVCDQVFNGCIQMPLEYGEALKNIKPQLEMLMQLMQTMRSAYHDDHKTTWYQILKKLESPAYFKPSKDYFERVSAVQNLLQYVENEAVELAEETMAIYEKMSGEEAEFWGEVVDGLLQLSITTHEIAPTASFVTAEDLSDGLRNQFTHLNAWRDLAHDQMSSVEEPDKEKLERIMKKILGLEKMAQTMIKGMRGAGITDLRAKIIEMIADVKAE